jgi:hypothetical protein
MPLPGSPPVLQAADMPSIARFLNEAADAIDPELLSPADKARILPRQIKAGNRLSSYMRHQAEGFEKAARGEIKPSRAFNTIQLSWLSNTRFQAIMKDRPNNHHVQGVSHIRDTLKQIESIARAQPLSTFTRWPPVKFIRTTAIGGLVALPVAFSLLAAIWNKDGPDDIAKDTIDRLGYATADAISPPTAQRSENKVLICEFLYSANAKDSPERQAYHKQALEIAREKAQGKDGLGSLATQFEHGVNVYIHTYYPGQTPQDGVEIANEDGGCAANAKEIEAFMPK